MSQSPGLPETLATACNPGMCLLALPVIFRNSFRNFSSRVPESNGEALPSDVFALAMVGAALRDQDRVPVLQIVKRLCAADDCFQISFVPRKQDRERGQRNFRRNDRCHFREDRGCRHDEGKFGREAAEACRKARCPG